MQSVWQFLYIVTSDFIQFTPSCSVSLCISIIDKSCRPFLLTLKQSSEKTMKILTIVTVMLSSQNWIYDRNSMFVKTESCKVFSIFRIKKVHFYSEWAWLIPVEFWNYFRYIWKVHWIWFVPYSFARNPHYKFLSCTQHMSWTLI